MLTKPSVAAPLSCGLHGPARTLKGWLSSIRIVVLRRPAFPARSAIWPLSRRSIVRQRALIVIVVQGGTQVCDGQRLRAVFGAPIFRLDHKIGGALGSSSARVQRMPRVCASTKRESFADLVDTLLGSKLGSFRSRYPHSIEDC